MTEWVRGVGSAGLALVLGCSMLGCNKSQPQSSVPRETVRGKVTYKGEPLPSGFLHFYNGAGHVGVGMIKPDGSGAYEASIPAGPVQAIVKADSKPDRVGMPPRRPGMPPGGPGMPPGGLGKPSGGFGMPRNVPGMPPGGPRIPLGPPGAPGDRAVAQRGGPNGPGKEASSGVREGSKLSPGSKLPPGLAPDVKQVKLMEEVQKKYGSLRTDKPLTFVVGPGEQTWNINLD